MVGSPEDNAPSTRLGPGYEVRAFGGRPMCAHEARDIARMHEEMLAHSPLVLMGSEFVEQFYYRMLPEDGLIHGAIAYVDGEAAGFIVATSDPAAFMSKAMVRHRTKIAWILLKTVLKKPSRLLAMKEAYQIQRNVQDQQYGPGVGELLSFGVRPQYRTRQFVRSRELAIGDDLMSAALKRLAELDVTEVRAIVDKDNLEAQLFYRAQGWQVGLKTVKGWRVPTMEFLKTLDEAPQLDGQGE